ncbi:hypothetical protein EYF80_030493 [Liparis tanakae]|uniref:Uncharacterized protein n=1 Tax=Liparis tanakae TaxID=230148 RepID=A0A4Z2H0M4_9TELE|nr:hypothetical protein EYF80_030493 [Liparis tanakae]
MSKHRPGRNTPRRNEKEQRHTGNDGKKERKRKEGGKEEGRAAARWNAGAGSLPTAGQRAVQHRGDHLLKNRRLSSCLPVNSVGTLDRRRLVTDAHIGTFLPPGEEKVGLKDQAWSSTYLRVGGSQGQQEEHGDTSQHLDPRQSEENSARICASEERGTSLDVRRGGGEQEVRMGCKKFEER